MFIHFFVYILNVFVRGLMMEVSSFVMFWSQCQTCEKAFELTRVSIVNEQKEVLYDQLVKPYNSITNYLTR